MRRNLLILLLAAGIGVLDTIILKSFEWAVNHGTNYIWNDLFQSDTYRWRVLPLAVLLGAALSWLFAVTRQKRVVQPKLNSLEADAPTQAPTLASIGIICLIGLASLLAGASLGPEASLVALASGAGLWIAFRTGFGKAAGLLDLASVGGLLVGFVGSYIIVLLPLLILRQKQQLRFSSALPVLLTGATAFGTLWLIDPSTAGYGNIPASPHFTVVDFLLAIVLGVAAAILGWLLKQLILAMSRAARKLELRWHWAVTGALFGLPIGLLYWAGGPTIQFSGSEGSKLLLQHQPAYGMGMLALILLTKLLATSWSLASGYRGGLVFPSVFIGVAVTLLVEGAFGHAGSGVLLGSIAGVFSAMLNPAVALIFMASIIPFKLIGVAISGIIGALVGGRLVKQLAGTLATVRSRSRRPA